MKRHAHNLSHTRTLTAKMGKCYPLPLMPVYPGDSFRLSVSNLTRFLPQVAPTMHEVNIGVDTYQVPLRQIFDKLGISWDKHLTGGRKGMDNIPAPTITIPQSGYEPGSLADFLGYPTNYIDPDTGDNVIVGAGLQLNALRVLAYMHVIGENYVDQNFIGELDYTKYQEFLDGTYEWTDAAGVPLEYQLLENGIFPKAWSRDYFGRALPDTQRGPQAMLPITGSTSLTPSTAPVLNMTILTATNPGGLNLGPGIATAISNVPSLPNGVSYTGQVTSASTILSNFTINIVPGGTLRQGIEQLAGTFTTANGSTFEVYINPSSVTSFAVRLVRIVGNEGQAQYSYAGSTIAGGWTSAASQVADLSNIDGLNVSSAQIIAFRLAARMQHFGEVLQQSGARAVEFTLAMFGVRIPDDRIQRPLFHGSFKLPVVFSEVLQTSATQNDSPQGNLAGHGITGGQNQPIHIKVIEHGFIVHIMHVMPRSQYQNILPKDLLYSSRFDYPNPIFQHVGEQAVKRVEIYPNSANPDEAFGFVPRYSELMHIPSTLHGHMKDTFLHWTMARLYNNGEPVLSAKWRYESPTQRSFAVQDEDQMQIALGFTVHARRPYARNPQPGIHIV